MTLSPCGQFAKSGPLWIKRIFSRCFKSAFLGYELHVLKRKKPWDRLVVQYLESFEYNKIGSRKIFKDDEITFLSLPSLGFVMLVLFCLHLPPTPPWSALLSWHGKVISLTMCFFFSLLSFLVSLWETQLGLGDLSPGESVRYWNQQVSFFGVRSA